MTYPVYIGDRATGTMTVTAAGQDTVFELRCLDPEPGLWRAWVQGEEGRLDLGLLEGGRLRRSRNALRAVCLRRAGGELTRGRETGYNQLSRMGGRCRRRRSYVGLLPLCPEGTGTGIMPQRGPTVL